MFFDNGSGLLSGGGTIVAVVGSFSVACEQNAFHLNLALLSVFGGNRSWRSNGQCCLAVVV